MLESFNQGQTNGALAAGCPHGIVVTEPLVAKPQMDLPDRRAAPSHHVARDDRQAQAPSAPAVRPELPSVHAIQSERTASDRRMRRSWRVR